MLDRGKLTKTKRTTQSCQIQCCGWHVSVEVGFEVPGLRLLQPKWRSSDTAASPLCHCCRSLRLSHNFIRVEKQNCAASTQITSALTRLLEECAQRGGIKCGRSYSLRYRWAIRRGPSLVALLSRASREGQVSSFGPLPVDGGHCNQHLAKDHKSGGERCGDTFRTLRLMSCVQQQKAARRE